jgi:hypothetical protein
MKKLVNVFSHFLYKAAGLDARIYENPAIDAANKAVGKLSVMAKKETLIAAKSIGDTSMSALVKKDLTQLPKAWELQPKDSFRGALDALESGLKAAIDRVTQLANKDTSAEYWLGFSREKAHGQADPTKQQNSGGKQDKQQQDDAYFRQLNAQRAMRARQAAVRYTQAMQRERMQQEQREHKGASATQPTAATMQQLVSGDMINALRNAMKTAANAAPVETGSKAITQQVLQQKDQAVKASRQRVTIEQVGRAKDRRDAQSHSPSSKPPEKQPIKPAPHKKRDQTHGL